MERMSNSSYNFVGASARRRKRCHRALRAHHSPLPMDQPAAAETMAAAPAAVAAPPAFDSLKLSLYTAALVARAIDTFIVLKDATGAVKYKCAAAPGGAAVVRDAAGSELASLTRLYSTDGSAPTYRICVKGDADPLILITPHTAKGRRCLLALYDPASCAVRYRMTAPWLHVDCDAPASGELGHDAPLLTVTAASSGERLAHGRLNSGFLASLGLVLSPDDAWAYQMDVTADPAGAPVAVAALCAIILATVVHEEAGTASAPPSPALEGAVGGAEEAVDAHAGGVGALPETDSAEGAGGDGEPAAPAAAPVGAQGEDGGALAPKSLLPSLDGAAAAAAEAAAPSSLDLLGESRRGSEAEAEGGVVGASSAAAGGVAGKQPPAVEGGLAATPAVVAATPAPAEGSSGCIVA